jgi:hypothetical protein
VLRVMASVHSSPNSFLYRNGVQIGTGAIPLPAGTNQFAVACTKDPSLPDYEPWRGRILAALVYPVAHTPTQVQAVTAWLSQYYHLS